MNGEETALVPKLRFPEFREGTGWEVKPLSALARRQSKRNADQKITRVLTNSAEHGVVDQRDYFEKDIATQGNLDSYFIVALGDYVYNPRISNTAPVGPIGKNKVGTGVMSPLYTVFRFVSNENSFYEQYFRSSYWHKYLQQISNSGARHDRMAISADAFIGMPLPAPDPAEQQKIADCLKSADELIAAQAEKVEALKAHKKGLMQQLFPRPEHTQNGQKIPPETKPRLRFSEFEGAGDWEEKQLGEYASFSSGGTPFKDNSDYWNGSIPWISASSMHELVVNKADHYVTPQAIGNGTRIAQKGSILILVRGSMLFKRVPICLAGLDVAFNQDVKALKVNACLNSEFLLYHLVAFQSQFQITETGIGAGKIDLEQLKGFKLFIPKLAEQLHVASCLANIDGLINAQSKKLDSLKVHKKGLMQQLFPSHPETEA